MNCSKEKNYNLIDKREHISQLFVKNIQLEKKLIKGNGNGYEENKY